VSLEQLDLDGTLVIDPSARDPNLDYLQRRRLPMVAIGKPSGVCGGVPYVDIHSALTTGRLLDHLHVQGASQVAMVPGSVQRNSYVESEAAYQAWATVRGPPSLPERANEGCDEDGATRVEKRGQAGARGLARRRLA
jgi:DNA-binding LacI/PurR family transcriptional regulator